MTSVKISDADDSWAEVELFRWQYGHLPQDDNRPLDVSEGLIGMSKGIKEGLESKDYSKMPAPFNVCLVLEYCARKFKI